MDKLSSPNYLVNFSIAGKELEELPTKSSKMKKKIEHIEAPEVLIPQQKVLNRVLEERKEQKTSIGDNKIRNLNPSLPYETFQMNQGVKLFYEENTKGTFAPQVRDTVETLTSKISGGFE